MLGQCCRFEQDVVLQGLENFGRKGLISNAVGINLQIIFYFLCLKAGTVLTLNPGLTAI